MDSVNKPRRWLPALIGAGLVLAALLGAVTPFCSCSSIPLFIGFVAAGVPLSITLSFLIASPPLGDPNFDHTVVLMIEHNPEAELGVEQHVGQCFLFHKGQGLI